MTPGIATPVQIAALFIWLGMVLAISSLETPLEFRVSGFTVPLGVGIGRRIYRALNAPWGLVWPWRSPQSLTAVMLADVLGALLVIWVAV